MQHSCYKIHISGIYYTTVLALPLFRDHPLKDHLWEELSAVALEMFHSM
jgi:hypothetical protein